MSVISTHTISLQQQLLSKDIPFLIRMLGVDIKAVLVKGMSNYLCLRKLEEAREELLLLPTQESIQIEKIQSWSESTQEGFRSGIPFSLFPQTWDKVSCKADDCTHNRCPFYKKCFFFKARKEAEEAQILIVNHHLLMADTHARIRQEGVLEKSVLPRFSRLIIDEAHHLEQVALDTFANTICRAGTLALLGSLFSEPGFAIPSKIPFALEKPTFKHALDVEIPALKRDALSFAEKAFGAIFYFLEKGIWDVKKGAKEQKLRITDPICALPSWKEEVESPCSSLLEILNRLSQALSSIDKELDAFKETKSEEDAADYQLEVRSFLHKLEEKIQDLHLFLSDEKKEKRVKWIEISSLNITLVSASLDVADLLQEHLFSKVSTTVLCSATLTTAGHFSYIKQRLGIDRRKKEEVLEHLFESPFDYASRVLLAIPTDLPDPSDSQFSLKILEPLSQIILASKGDAFLLFTSYEMLQQVFAALSQDKRLSAYLLLKQGDLSRHLLLEKFKKTKGSVLFATNSFWEGVDVPGDALRCVVIVKLPFVVPSEPLYQACSEALQKMGKNPFYEYAIPQAITRFKQGFGRLMRHKKDGGAIICLDHRLTTKNYGKRFLESLPACKRSSGPFAEVLEEISRHYASLKI
ncbi:MAG: ATP-dependent DNA helicase DinG [Chlamydiales bacterium]|nr:ATP-dependent DNA helicase DinG [Chlamydiales bacterium]